MPCSATAPSPIEGKDIVERSGERATIWAEVTEDAEGHRGPYRTAEMHLRAGEVERTSDDGGNPAEPRQERAGQERTSQIVCGHRARPCASKLTGA
jgi:hypothetical protein